MLIQKAMLAIFLGDGTRSFADQLTFPLVDDIWLPELLAADIDNNNRTDLLFTQRTSREIIMFLNFNQTSWSEIIIYDLDPPGEMSIAAAVDLNNDHYSDLFILIHQSSDVRVVLDQGNKTFASPLIFSSTEEHPYRLVQPGYFNDDRDVDLVFIDGYEALLWIYRGNRDGTFNFSHR